MFIRVGKELLDLRWECEEFPYCCAQTVLCDWRVDKVGKYKGDDFNDGWGDSECEPLEENEWKAERDRAPTGANIFRSLIDTCAARHTYLIADVKDGCADKYVLKHIQRLKNVSGERNKAVLTMSPWYPGSHGSPVRTLLFSVSRKEEASK